MAIAAPATEIAGLPTSALSNASFTATAISMESAAYFARPIPVRQAASVSTPARLTAETDVSRRSVTSVSASSVERCPYNMDTTGRASANSPTAQGRDKISVNAKAYRARVLPSSRSPRAKQADTAGTLAAAKP